MEVKMKKIKWKEVLSEIALIVGGVLIADRILPTSYYGGLILGILLVAGYVYTKD